MQKRKLDPAQSSRTNKRTKTSPEPTDNGKVKAVPKKLLKTPKGKRPRDMEDDFSDVEPSTTARPSDRRRSGRGTAQRSYVEMSDDEADAEMEISMQKVGDDDELENDITLASDEDEEMNEAEDEVEDEKEASPPSRTNLRTKGGKKTKEVRKASPAQSKRRMPVRGKTK
jgi:sister chromatid cohesion protein PDS5